MGHEAEEARKKTRPASSSARSRSSKGATRSAGGNVAPAETAAQLRGSASPAPNDVLALQRSVGNQGVTTLLRDDPAPASKSKRPTKAELPDGQAGPQSATVAAPQVAQAAAANQGPVIQRAGATDTVATAPSATEAIAEVLNDWHLVQRLLGTLTVQTTTILDEALETARQNKKKKKIAKLTKHRKEATTELAAMSQAALAAYREADQCESDLEMGVSASASKIPALGAVVADTLTQLTRGLMNGAKLAHEHGDRRRAALFTLLAEDAEEAGGELDHGSGGNETSPTAKDVLGSATTYADTANNAGPGVIGGTIGLVESVGDLTSGMAPISSASQAVGGVFGGLGIVFGSIGIGLGANAWRKGGNSERELDALAGTLDNDELVDATKYASAKKFRKKNRGKAGVLSGSLAVVAGGAALFAIAFAFLGPGAAILGIGAALIGIGFLVGKYIHKRAKRTAYAKQLADKLLDALNDDTAPAAQAEAQTALEEYGIDHANQDDKTTKAQLVTKFKAAGESRRKETARTIYAALVGDDVSAQIDAERVVETLHLKHEKLRALTPKDAIEAIADKMKSW